MTRSRRSVYRKSWYRRECKIDMRLRRKEYNRKIRYAKIDDDYTCAYVRNLNKLVWNTIS